MKLYLLSFFIQGHIAIFAQNSYLTNFHALFLTYPFKYYLKGAKIKLWEVEMVHKNNISPVINNQLVRLASDFKNNILDLCLHNMMIIFPLGSEYRVNI